MIYVVRHGQTDWNLHGLYQGQMDIELNDTGIRQAIELKKHFNSIALDAVYSSPLKRAIKTASIIYDGEIILDRRIIERGNGELEGKSKSAFKGKVNFADPYDVRFGVEPLLSFRSRIENFFQDISRLYPSKNVLVVTHGGVSIYAKCFFEGEPLDGNYSSLIIQNCNILEFKN